MATRRTRKATEPDTTATLRGRKKKKKGSSSSSSAGGNVACWEDDPGEPDEAPPRAPITVAKPDQAKTPLAYSLQDKAPAATLYKPGSTNFLYYANAAALRRTADFWGSIVPEGTTWQIGDVLPVFVDDGEDLNAFYTRGEDGGAPGLHFFHQEVDDRTYYSGESPDVCCHEMGHAVLDALRPQLFDANAIEAAAFHESFGDMSAILSACQVPSFRTALIEETDGVLNRSSRLSRLAEQLGAAIRRGQPDAVDPDCLRNAANSFFYVDPQTLPPSAPASQLCSEPHSFSRVFTGAFLDALAGIFTAQGGTPSSDGLVAATRELGTLLVTAVTQASVVPDYYAQVAAQLVRIGGDHSQILKTAFVKKGILSLQAATTLGAPPRRARRKGATRAIAAAAPSAALPVAALSASNYGLKSAVLHTHMASEPRLLAVTGSSALLGPSEARSSQNAAESYTEDLFQLGRIDIGKHGSDAAVVNPWAFKTHRIVDQQGALTLKRITFDCGFHDALRRRVS